MSGFAEALEQARDAGDLLSGGTFSQETAADLDGSGLDFRDCRFQSCQFRDCDFSGAAFYGCTFTDCLLEDCRLSATYWRNCRLFGCKWMVPICAVPGGRTVHWRRHCFVMSTLPAVSGSIFP